MDGGPVVDDRTMTYDIVRARLHGVAFSQNDTMWVMWFSNVSLLRHYHAVTP